MNTALGKSCLFKGIVQMKDMEMSQAILVHQVVFKLSLKSQTCLCVYLRDMAGFICSTFEVWGRAKFARELKMRSKTVSCVTTFAPNNNEKVKILFCRM